MNSHSAFRHVLVSWAVIALLAVAAAADYPPAGHPVNDSAGRLSEHEVANLTAATEAADGAEIVVVVIDHVSEYAPNASLESFATRLFNQRGIGDPVRNDGVLILLAAGDRELRIEVGSGYGRRLDGPMKRVIDRDMVPHLRRGDYAGGLAAGIDGVRAVLAGPSSGPAATPEAPGPKQLERVAEDPPPAPAAPPPASRHGIGAWLADAGKAAWAALAAALAAVVFIVRKVLRHRPRSCPNCKRSMIRLSELDDDEYLDDGQQTEEAVGSVDYDVWLCQACGERILVRYGGWLSSYQECPDCHNRTLGVRKWTEVQPTTTSTGVRRVEKECLQCDYKITYKEVIAKQASHHHHGSSSSRGLGSFGGGRSSGGGASGKW